MNLSPILAIELLLLYRIIGGCSRLSVKERVITAFVGLSVILCLSTEVLSIFSLLQDRAITLFHVILTAGLLIVRYRWCGNLAPQKTQATSERADLGIALLLATPALISALAAPPNNWDSMTYHLPRVFHWLQNHSLEHYPTFVVRQLYLSPGHEFILTHLIALAGSDVHGGMLNAISFFVALLSIAAITEKLGRSKAAQLFATTLAATIPMAILQSHTTQNDLLHGVYLLAFILGALLTRESPTTLRNLLMFCSAGLAVLTKGLSFLFLPPVLLLFFPLTTLRSPRNMIAILIGALLALGLNIGHWHRNYIAFGYPLGPTTGSHTVGMYSVSAPTTSTTVSNVARNLALHSNSAFPLFNRVIMDSIGPIHNSFSIDQNDPRTTWMGTGMHSIHPTAINEDLSGNGNHLFLAVATIVLALFTTRRSFHSRLLALRPLFAAVLAALVLSALVKWQPWASRLHLPLFLVAIPSMAIFITQRLGLIVTALTSIFVVTQAWPYWAHNPRRPLAGPHSIIYQPARLERFSAKQMLQPEFKRISRYLRHHRCRSIGLIASEDEWEQPLFTNLYTRPVVHACPAPADRPNELWLPERVHPSPNVCALVWLGADAPEQVSTCGGNFVRIGEAMNMSIFKRESR